MHCIKCGTENLNNATGACPNCLEPLPINSPDPAMQKSVPAGKATHKLETGENQTAGSQGNDDDYEMINMANPLDFIMGEKPETADHNDSSKRDETIKPEPIEDNLTLYRDENIKLSISESGGEASLNIETLKGLSGNNTPSTPSDKDVIRQEPALQTSTPEEDANQPIETLEGLTGNSGPIDSPEDGQDIDNLMTKIQKLAGHKTDDDSLISTEPEIAGLVRNSYPEADTQTADNSGPPADKPAPLDSNADETLEYTRKMKTPEPAPELTPQFAQATKAIKKKTPLPEPKISPVKQTTGVIYLKSNKLTLPGSARLKPGDEIKIGDKSFRVKAGSGSKKWLFALIGMILIGAAGAGAYYNGMIPLGVNGSLVGTLIKAKNRNPLSNSTIRLKELNKTVNTTNAGFFIFENVPSGIYTIEYLEGGHPVSESQITILAGKTSTMILSDDQHDGPLSETQDNSFRQPADIAPSKSKHGTLTLKLKPANASVFLDDQPLGAGSNQYEVRPGKYQLTIKSKGYEDKSVEIAVFSGKTISRDFSLNQVKTTSDAEKSPEKLAFKSEIAGNYHQALRYYDNILEKNQDDIGALMGKARCFRGDGNLNKAYTYYMRTVEVAENNGDKISQIDGLTGIIEIRPQTFSAYYARGDLLYSMGQYNRAARDFKMVTELDRYNLKAFYRLGDSYYYGENYYDAMLAYQAAEETNLSDPKAQVKLAKTYLALGDKANVKKTYDKFRELAGYTTIAEYKGDPEWRKVLNSLGVEN